MRFVNREKESAYLHNHFSSEPNSLLFLYGPKSSGKSTLLSKIVNELDTRKFAINFLDLRGVIIYDFKSFLNVFFPKSIRGKVKDILQGIINETPGWVRALMTFIDVIAPGKSDQTYYIGDNGSFINIPDGAIPPEYDSIYCASWSWYGNSPGKTLSVPLR